MKLEIGNIVKTSKKHPCKKEKNDEFEILRVGMDFRIKCLGCGKQIWISRINFEKRIKKIIKQ